jgi:hypothetical protein
VQTYYDCESEKWGYSIARSKNNGDIERMIRPRPVFTSEDLAKECGERDLEEIMKINTSKTRKRVEDIFER